MKLRFKGASSSGSSVATLVKAKRTNTVEANASVVTKSSVDTDVMYVGRRIPKMSIAAKVIGEDIPSLTDDGFLVVTGDKPGILIHEVRWDGTDMYSRAGHFGSLSALNSSGNKKFKAEIIDRKELLERLRVKNRVVSATNVASGDRVTVAVLNSPSDPYCAGVQVLNGNLEPLVMEPKARYNTPAVQYTDLKEEKVDINKFLPKR